MDFFAEAELAMEMTSEYEEQEIDSDEEVSSHTKLHTQPPLLTPQTRFAHFCCVWSTRVYQDQWGNNVVALRHREAMDRVVRLPDGDFHYCDCHCPFSHPDKDGNRVCEYTGIVVGTVTVERTDNSTGRSTWSSDPDVSSGGPMGGAWRKKRDMHKASSTAFNEARTLDDTEMPKAIEVPRAVRSACKRGALCVDEVAPADTCPKRARVSKKNVTSLGTRTMLIDEALSTFSKLLGKPQSPATPKLHTIDPRLLDKRLLFHAALKKYLKETLASGNVPFLDDISNIELAVTKVVGEEKEKNRIALASEGRVHSVHFRAAAARLAVALWSGACSTPYLAKARRGADSFRPFCAGVYYGFKRGISLADGTVLVPKLSEFTDAMPTPREIASDPASKSLHASSHRGLCTVHRAIASIDPQQATRVFAQAVSAAKAF